MSGQWQGSTRKATLPPNWHALRKQILERDEHSCQWMTDGEPCGAHATHVDHKHRKGGDAPSNLRALCAWHHNRKSSSEGHEAQTRHSTARPREQHPGLA